MINVITIDREYGSGAADIASKLAERLGWKLWDELLTIEIAHRVLEGDHLTKNGKASSGRSASIRSSHSMTSLISM